MFNIKKLFAIGTCILYGSISLSQNTSHAQKLNIDFSNFSCGEIWLNNKLVESIDFNFIYDELPQLVNNVFGLHREIDINDEKSQQLNDVIEKLDKNVNYYMTHCTQSSSTLDKEAITYGLFVNLIEDYSELLNTVKILSL